jgi:hypothetical protein
LAGTPIYLNRQDQAKQKFTNTLLRAADKTGTFKNLERNLSATQSSEQIRPSTNLSCENFRAHTRQNSLEKENWEKRSQIYLL